MRALPIVGLLLVGGGFASLWSVHGTSFRAGEPAAVCERASDVDTLLALAEEHAPSSRDSSLSEPARDEPSSPQLGRGATTPVRDVVTAAPSTASASAEVLSVRPLVDAIDVHTNIAHLDLVAAFADRAGDTTTAVEARRKIVALGALLTSDDPRDAGPAAYRAFADASL